MSAVKTAIVTGGGGGIGRAIALRLARDGFDLTVTDLPDMSAEVHETAQEIERFGRKAHVDLGDVTVRSDVDRLVASHAQNVGPLYCLVANAGICLAKPAVDMTEEEVHRMFEVNVVGVFNCYQAASREMISTKTQGRIIGASSIVGKKAFPLLTTYSASKFAVRGLTQAFAMEMAPHGIRVNAYCPGLHETKMLEKLDDELRTYNGLPKGETMSQLADQMIALKRKGTGDDVAKLVSFLASDDSEYMTGQSINIDGGINFS